MRGLKINREALLVGLQSPYQSIEEEVEILRAKAAQLRNLASEHQTGLSPKLIEMADELEARAGTLDRRLRAFRADKDRMSSRRGL